MSLCLVRADKPRGSYYSKELVLLEYTKLFPISVAVVLDHDMSLDLDRELVRMRILSLAGAR